MSSTANSESVQLFSLSFKLERLALEEHIEQLVHSIQDDTSNLTVGPITAGQGVGPQNQYRMINYKSDAELSFLEKQCRSVVYDVETGGIISMSLSKSIPFDEFAAKYPIHYDDTELTVSVDHIQIADFVDGTMINVFWTGLAWDIATKTKFGGHSRYYTNPLDTRYSSFRTMFFDALEIHNNQFAESSFQNHSLIQSLDKTRSYSFVLQHPDSANCFATPIPMIYLVAVFQMGPETIDSIPQAVFEADTPYHQLLHFPYIHDELAQTTVSENTPVNVWETIREMVSAYNSGPSSIGVMITNYETGERTKIISADYIARSEMRGHHPNHMVQYLDIICVRGYREEFVDMFRQFDGMFRTFDQVLDYYLQTVYYWYVAFFCHRQRNVPKHYMTVIHQLHNEVYIGCMRDVGAKMSQQSVTAYLMGMPILDLYKNIMTHHKFMIGHMPEQAQTIGDDNV